MSCYCFGVVRRPGHSLLIKLGFNNSTSRGHLFSIQSAWQPKHAPLINFIDVIYLPSFQAMPQVHIGLSPPPLQ